MTVNRIAVHRITLNRMTVNRMTPGRRTQWQQLFNVITESFSAESHFTGCHSSDCHSAKCHGTTLMSSFQVKIFFFQSLAIFYFWQPDIKTRFTDFWNVLGRRFTTFYSGNKFHDVVSKCVCYRKLLLVAPGPNVLKNLRPKFTNVCDKQEFLLLSSLSLFSPRPPPFEYLTERCSTRQASGLARKH